MRASAVLAVTGVVLVLAQWVWAPVNVPMPWGLAPLILGLVALIASIITGLVLGGWMYRLAIALGVLSVTIIVLGFTARLHARPDIPVPSPTNNEIVVMVGLVVAGAAVLLGAAALHRGSRTRAEPEA